MIHLFTHEGIDYEIEIDLAKTIIKKLTLDSETGLYKQWHYKGQVNSDVDLTITNSVEVVYVTTTGKVCYIEGLSTTMFTVAKNSPEATKVRVLENGDFDLDQEGRYQHDVVPEFNEFDSFDGLLGVRVIRKLIANSICEKIGVPKQFDLTPIIQAIVLATPNE